MRFSIPVVQGIHLPFQVPESALQLGFFNDPLGTHGSRTMMMSELRLLLKACPSSATLQDYRAAVIENNVLLKKTASTRQESFRRLRELYALNTDVILFRALRDLWDDNEQAQPLLALLCAAARDPLLRATADLILATPVGDTITPHVISDAIAETFPDRYSKIILANIGRHAASSWQQSGHLQGRLHKVRSRAESSPAAIAYALLFGYLCGARGEGLFQTVWAQLLDASVHSLYELAVSAAQRGYIDYRHSGSVIEISFRHLLRDFPLS
ncbi:MAG: hypothetical protein HY782_07395 [Chloroflexi bacterium]|nr:hypothetical protein [Chloroflexota bacterium]